MSARHHFSTRAEGDFADPDGPPHPGGGVPARPWTWLRQVHGARVVTVTRPGEHAGAEADAAVTATPDCGLVVRTADCAPVWFDGGAVVGLAHAGWKGLEAGVLERTVSAMRGLGAEAIHAGLGPCIHAECYEFGDGDLARLADRFGSRMRATTAGGAPALDLVAAVGAVLQPLAVDVDVVDSYCTSCFAEGFFSYRARADTARQASFAWLEP